VRLKLYRALVRAGEDGLAVGAIQAKLGSRRRRWSITVGTHGCRLISQERQATTLIWPRQLSGDERSRSAIWSMSAAWSSLRQRKKVA